MKNLFRLPLTLCLLGTFVLASHAQVIKTAYANEAFIISQLPETKQAEANVRAFQNQLETHLKAKMDEFQNKSQDFQQNYERMSDLERADKQEELATLQESVVKFQRNAETSIQEKQQKELLPVIEKIQKAIDEIAAAGNYTYIFKADALLYAKDSQDISLTVLKRLGVDTSKIKAPSASPSASPPTKKIGN